MDDNRYWPLDACNLYWNDLKGEKYLIYVPNNGHGLNDRARLVAGLNALNRSVLTGKPLPKLQWTYADNGGGLDFGQGSNDWNDNGGGIDMGSNDDSNNWSDT